jgi:transcriptional regulator with XRE-family HTH domain
MHPLEQWRAQESERRQRTLRRRELAEELGCSASRYTQIVKHKQPPSSALAKRIKALTGISIDKIMEAAQ